MLGALCLPEPRSASMSAQRPAGTVACMRFIARAEDTGDAIAAWLPSMVNGEKSTANMVKTRSRCVSGILLEYALEQMLATSRRWTRLVEPQRTGEA